MSFSVGIIGLPNVGKSTFFKALTLQEVDISNYPFCTIKPNIGIVEVPDERLKKISEIVKPKKTTPVIIEFVDIAGLVKGAHKGEGLGNQFLSHIREVDAVIHIVRGFPDKEIKHVEDSIDPLRDIEIINIELIMKDLETLEKHLAKLEKEVKSKPNKEIIKEIELLQKIKKELNQNKMIFQLGLSSEENELIRHLNFLTNKPMVYLLNINEDSDYSHLLRTLPENTLPIDLKLELESTELSPEEREELQIESRIDIIIKTCYKILNLVTFYTIKGGEETRAWAIKEGTPAREAAGIVHTDFKERFIRAEVIGYKDLIETGSWTNARAKGLIKTEGKEYIIKDGDVVEFKI